MAARILAWRTANGRFTAVEDLMSVSGIGEKTFEGLRDLVTT
jgi:competence protein ComEA